MEVMFGKEKVTLKGNTVKLGDIAENFTAINTRFQEKSLDDFTEKVLVISVVPSLDTGVCDYQTKTFNKALEQFKKVKVITISNDLPFAQERWCGSSGLDHVITLSDHRNLDFAMKYGTLIEKHRLQTRAVFVLDQDRKIVYKEFVPVISDHPSYEEVTEVIKELL